MRRFCFKRAALALMLASAPLMALADAPAPSMADYLQAAGNLKTLMESTRTQASAPRLSDAEAGPWLRTITDPRILQLTRKMDLTSQTNVCKPVAEVLMGYVAWGADLEPKYTPGMASAPQAAQKESDKAIQLANANVMTYQNEVTLLGAFGVRCVASFMPEFEQFARTLKPEAWDNDRLYGLSQMQTESTGMITGGLRQINAPGTSPANRQLLLSALSDSAPELVSIISLSARQPLVALAGQIQPQTDEEKSALTQIKAALENTDCNALCSRSAQAEKALSPNSIVFLGMTPKSPKDLSNDSISPGIKP